MRYLVSVILLPYNSHRRISYVSEKSDDSISMALEIVSLQTIFDVLFVKIRKSFEIGMPPITFSSKQRI